ncbi:RNA polymerase sigma factor [Amycolatopsis sp. NPDC098790]|uniref:RNA polymerase sigma factor n=1 Tax=Amycolatopsis sp. NPDC098790 TaxID=3363939 RepID=UPI0038074156
MNPELLRTLAPQVLAALVRRYGDFEACEDAVQEALLAASQQWPSSGIPDHPKGWLITTASRRRIEQLRSESARQRREVAVALSEPPDPLAASGVDDTLTLLQLCCHPALPRPSQVALTLRAVGGLTTAEIARAFLVPEATIGQRISRAKRSLRGVRFAGDDRPERLAAVLEVLYLIFTEGHTASSGGAVSRVELTTEAIRLVRGLHAEVPADGEVTGLLALMLLTEARRPARVSASGALVPLAAQDRSLWNGSFIAEGVALITGALVSAPIGPYQLQAAIAAVHAEASSAETTDWTQILTLYDLLRVVAPGPMVTLNRVVAFAQVHGAEAGLAELARASDPALVGHYRVDVVRGHLLEEVGDFAGAREAYSAAARRTLSLPEQAYLQARAAKLKP